MRKPAPRILSFENRTALLRTMREVGAYQCAQQSGIVSETKTDGSKVTQVDKESQRALIAKIAELTPNLPVLGEESSQQDQVRAITSPQPLWVIDPLDGTASFVDGYDQFGINVALLSAPDKDKERRVLFGAVYFPKKDEMFFADLQPETFAKCTILQTEGGAKSRPLLVKHIVDDKLRIAEGYKDKGSRRLPENTFEAAPYTGGYRSAQVLKGEADLAMFDKPSAIWDIAPLEALIRGAGGVMRVLNDKGFANNSPYFGANRHRYDQENWFQNRPYVCGHELLLYQVGLSEQRSALSSEKAQAR